MVANVDIKRDLIQIIRCDPLGEVISDGSARDLPVSHYKCCINFLRCTALPVQSWTPRGTSRGKWGVAINPPRGTSRGTAKSATVKTLQLWFNPLAG